MLFIKRLTLFIVAMALIVLAVAISGLNTEKVVLELYYFNFELSLGFLLILALFFGLLAGLLLSLFSYYMPLKSQIRKLSLQNRKAQKNLLSEKRLEHTDA